MIVAELPEPTVHRFTVERERVRLLLRNCGRRTDVLEAEMERVEALRDSAFRYLERLERSADLRQAAARLRRGRRTLEDSSEAVRIDEIAPLSSRFDLSITERIEVLLVDGEPRNATDIADLVSGAFHSVASALAKLRRAGRIAQLHDGRYLIVGRKALDTDGIGDA